MTMRMTRFNNRASNAIALVATLAGCAAGEEPKTALDSTAPSALADSVPPAVATSVGVTEGMSTPESVRYDADDDVFFVSNINGNPSMKDGNGFIARVNAASTDSMTKVIEGGKNGVTLHAPKGMVIVGDTLWVADIDALRGFNKNTGAPVATVNMASMGATFLNGVAAGPDGTVYVTDSGLRFDADGGMTHPGKDRIFAVTGRKATIALETDSLGAANGIAWDAANSRFILAGLVGKDVQTWKPGDKSVAAIATGPGGYDGVEVLSGSRIILSSWSDSAVHVLKDGKFEKIISAVDAPAVFDIDTKRNVLALPRFNAGRVEYWHLSGR